MFEFMKKTKLPKKGERYIFRKDKGDPFQEKGYYPVLVLEVLSGWVRYDMGTHSFYRDERKDVVEFMSLYRLST